MKILNFITIALSTFFLFACQSETKNKISEKASRETRTANVTYSLDIDHDETIALRSKQEITTSYPGGIQEITITGEYNEMIAGLTVGSGDIVKLAFKDVTDCHPDDDCIYTAILSIKVDGALVSSERFNCSNGQGSGEVSYEFD